MDKYIVDEVNPAFIPQKMEAAALTHQVKCGNSNQTIANYPKLELLMVTAFWDMNYTPSVNREDLVHVNEVYEHFCASYTKTIHLDHFINLTAEQGKYKVDERDGELHFKATLLLKETKGPLDSKSKSKDAQETRGSQIPESDQGSSTQSSLLESVPSPSQQQHNVISTTGKKRPPPNTNNMPAKNQQPEIKSPASKRRKNKTFENSIRMNFNVPHKSSEESRAGENTEKDLWLLNPGEFNESITGDLASSIREHVGAEFELRLNRIQNTQTPEGKYISSPDNNTAAQNGVSSSSSTSSYSFEDERVVSEDVRDEDIDFKITESQRPCTSGYIPIVALQSTNDLSYKKQNNLDEPMDYKNNIVSFWDKNYVPSEDRVGTILPSDVYELFVSSMWYRRETYEYFVQVSSTVTGVSSSKASRYLQYRMTPVSALAVEFHSQDTIEIEIP